MLAPEPAIYNRFPGLKMTLPEVVFADATKLTLPGVTLHLKYCAQHGHSHSKGDATLYFEEDDVLIAGDLLYTEVHPVTFFGNIPNWLQSLKPLFEMHYKQLVPGHGPVVDDEQTGRECTTIWKIFTDTFWRSNRDAGAPTRSLIICSAEITHPWARREWCDETFSNFSPVVGISRNLSIQLSSPSQQSVLG